MFHPELAARRRSARKLRVAAVVSLGVALAAWAYLTLPDRGRAVATSAHAPVHEPAATTKGPTSAWDAPLRTAVQQGIDASDNQGGLTTAGFWVDDSAGPQVLGSELGPQRLWSLSKPITAIATLEAAERKGGANAALMTAVTDAITTSDNCAQRLVVLQLQQFEGGLDGAQTAFESVLKRAGVTLKTKPTSGQGSGAAECKAYAGNGRTPPSPSAVAMQFGTEEWTQADAIRFIHAVAAGTYGHSGDIVLDLMRRPKGRALTGKPYDYTAPVDQPPSGGTLPAAWTPAYKGGWGGRGLNPPDFRASEVVALRVGGHTVVLGATFQPAADPPSDDPGLTKAPGALAAFFDRVRTTLSQLGGAPTASPSNSPEVRHESVPVR